MNQCEYTWINPEIETHHNLPLTQALEDSRMSLLLKVLSKAEGYKLSRGILIPLYKRYKKGKGLDRFY